MQITIEIPDELYYRIEAAAAAEGISVNDYVVRAIERALAESPEGGLNPTPGG